MSATNSDTGAALAAAACALLDESIEESPNLDAISRMLGVSASHLRRVFKRHVGVTPKQYVEARRRDVFKAHVKLGDSVTDALYEAGYSSPSRLYESATARLGMTPATYRRDGRGASIGYTVVPSSLGWLLVAATAHGICAVSLGDDVGMLAHELSGEFPAADIRLDDEGLRPQVEAVLELLEGEVTHEALPLDVAGTAFQMRVWEELRRIPSGETITYGELARRIGRPTASRAVARACATNPAAVITPCHRVVRGNGELGGYRWGIERKRRLLEAERERVR